MNSRFFPHDVILTDAVLSLDEDSVLSTNEVRLQILSANKGRCNLSTRPSVASRTQRYDESSLHVFVDSRTGNRMWGHRHLGRQNAA